MKALTFQVPYEVRCEEVPEPTLVEPRDALVRVELSAICGSDLHPYRGHETGLDRGTVMGHEFLGEVVAVGADVGSVVPGERVVSPFTTSCGVCFYCRRGLTCRCEQGALFGWVEGGKGLHGAQCELVRVPLADSTLVPVPGDAPAVEALFAGDVLSTGFFCAESADVCEGSVAVVLGCGPVGLMAVVGARELGAKTVFAVDSVSERLELARGFGAVPLELGSEKGHERVRDETGGRGADAVLEAAGSPEATRLAFELVRPGGTVAAAGVHTEERFAITPGDVYDKNLTYRAGRCPARSYAERLLELVRSQRYELGKIVSHRLALEEGPRAYEIFDKKLEGCTKVILEPGR